MPKSIFNSLLFVFLFLSLKISAQTIGAGINIGAGTLSGDSPNISCFGNSINIFFKPGWEESLTFKAMYIYQADVQSVLPGTKKPYTPYLSGVGAAIVHNNNTGTGLFFEEGIGIIFLNNRTYSDKNEWGPGILISSSIGTEVYSGKNERIEMLAGAEYGITLYNTYVRYFNLKLEAKYLFNLN